MDEMEQAGRRSGFPQSLRGGLDSGVYWTVLDRVGQRIVDGTTPAGSPLVAASLCKDFGASRAIVREAVRTLSSKGLVRSRPRAGTFVLPQAEWDLLDPCIVAWRSRSPSWFLQLQDLFELRASLEPTAAGLLARQSSRDSAQLLTRIVADMRQAKSSADFSRYCGLDIAFHGIVLRSAGNSLMACVADAVEAGSSQMMSGFHQRAEWTCNAALALHESLADALQHGNETATDEWAREIARITLTTPRIGCGPIARDWHHARPSGGRATA